MQIHHIAVVALSTAIVTCAQAATTLTIDQKGLQFSRKTASLAVGDKMIFTNTDEVIHNIQIIRESGEAEKNLGLQKPGAPLAYVFDNGGKYMVRCNIHAAMRMAVSVQ